MEDGSTSSATTLTSDTFIVLDEDAGQVTPTSLDEQGPSLFESRYLATGRLDQLLLEACQLGELATLKRLFRSRHVDSTCQITEWRAPPKVLQPDNLKLLFHTAIEYRQIPALHYIHDACSQHYFSDPCIVDVLVPNTRSEHPPNISLLKDIIHQVCPTIISWKKDDNLSISQLADRAVPSNELNYDSHLARAIRINTAPDYRWSEYIDCLLAHTPRLLGEYSILNYGNDLLLAITLHQPLAIIEKMMVKRDYFFNAHTDNYSSEENRCPRLDAERGHDPEI
jgi:hypothetical protein